MSRSYFIIAAVVVDTILAGVLCLIVGPFDYYFLKGRIIFRIARVYVRIILFISRVKVSIEWPDNLDTNKSYIIVANHQSLFDIPATFAYLPLSFRMIAKKELYRIPIFGWGIYLGRHISIDRQNRQKAFQSLEKAARFLRSAGVSIMLYPEGTRSPDGDIHTFKSGAFRLALQNQLPVLPVAIYGSRNILPKKSLKVTPGTIRMIIAQPIAIDEYSEESLGELIDRAQHVVVENFQKMRNEAVS